MESLMKRGQMSDYMSGSMLVNGCADSMTNNNPLITGKVANNDDYSNGIPATLVNGLDSGMEGVIDAEMDSGIASGIDEGIDSVIDAGIDSVIDAGIDTGNFGTIETYPKVIPDSPTFKVPANPLLPNGYNEILDYNAIQYLNGIYRTQIGRYVKVQMVMGTANLDQFEGYLVGVGINYIILQDSTGSNIRILDIYGIKDMYVYYAGEAVN